MENDVAKIRKELTDLVDKLKEQSDNVSQMSHVPSLEIHVMMARVNRLYEKAVLYKHILESEKMKIDIQAELSVPEQTPPPAEQPVPIPPPIETIEPVQAPPPPPPTTTPPLAEKKATPEQSAPKVPADILMADILSRKPIPSIKKALGINERYLFANELFGGKQDLLMQAIEEIEQQSTLENAMGIVQAKWALTYTWDLENPQVVAFLKIIERRFL